MPKYIDNSQERRWNSTNIQFIYKKEGKATKIYGTNNSGKMVDLNIIMLIITLKVSVLQKAQIPRLIK